MAFFDKIVAAVTPPESDEDRARARVGARQAASPGDWLDQIVQHHEQIEAAFARAEAANDFAGRTKAVKDLGGVLTGHASAEEAVIYPLLSEDHKVHMSMAYEEQQAAKVQMALLEALDPMSQDWIDKLGHIKGAVAHHVYEEESDRFLDLRKELPADIQAHMSERYREEIARYESGLTS